MTTHSVRYSLAQCYEIKGCFYRPQRRLCFYTFLSFCPQGWCLPQCMLGYHLPEADTPPERTPPPGSRHPFQKQTPQSRHPCRSRHPAGTDTPLGADTLQSRNTPREQTPPREQTLPTPHNPETAAAADGTHPTGMHSFFLKTLHVNNDLSFTLVSMGSRLCANSSPAHSWHRNLSQSADTW